MTVAEIRAASPDFIDLALKHAEIEEVERQLSDMSRIADQANTKTKEGASRFSQKVRALTKQLKELLR